MQNKIIKPLLVLLLLIPLTSCFNQGEKGSSDNKTSVDLESESTMESESINSEISEIESEVPSEDEPSDVDSTPAKSIDDFNSTPFIDSYIDKGYESLYEDVNFKDGYIVTKSTYGVGESPYHDNYLRIYPSFYTPRWSIAQWNSKYDILGNKDDPNAGYQLVREDDGLINTIISKGQTVNGQFLPGKIIKINSMTGEIYLECNCSIEYDKDRDSSDPWVHLLLANRWRKQRKISELSSIVMEANFTVNKCINYTKSENYSVNKHAAQLVWYVTLQNLNRSSLGYGKYIWFGVGLWDDRSVDKVANAYIAHDAGTDTLIYNPSSSYYYGNNYGKQKGVGQENNAYVDIYPILSMAFSEAQAKGYLSNTTWDDLYIGGTNFGYEVPGTFDISATIHSLGVFVK